MTEGERRQESLPLTGADHFRSMVARLREARRQPSYFARKEALLEAHKHAFSVLSAPDKDRTRIAWELRSLIDIHPHDAALALTTLRRAGVFKERLLRRRLGLPIKGRIIPLRSTRL